MSCPDGTRGKFVTVQRTQAVYDPSRYVLYVNEIDVQFVHIGIENGEVQLLKVIVNRLNVIFLYSLPHMQ